MTDFWFQVSFVRVGLCLSVVFLFLLSFFFTFLYLFNFFDVAVLPPFVKFAGTFTGPRPFDGTAPLVVPAGRLCRMGRRREALQPAKACGHRRYSALNVIAGRFYPA
jgi:hypothetical protein